MKFNPLTLKFLIDLISLQKTRIVNPRHRLSSVTLRILPLIFISCFVPGLSSAADQQGFIARLTSIQSEATPGSATLATIPVGSEVTVLRRKGGWYQVKTASHTGWVKFVAVRFQSSAPKGSTGLSEAALLLTKDTAPTLTAGVKGLQEEDLNNAKPNLEAVYMMGLYAVTPEQAVKFARDEQLRGAL